MHIYALSRITELHTPEPLHFHTSAVTCKFAKNKHTKTKTKTTTKKTKINHTKTITRLYFWCTGAIVGVDVSTDCQWIVATMKDSIALVNVAFRDPKTNEMVSVRACHVTFISCAL